jgi:hypothetical protein
MYIAKAGEKQDAYLKDWYVNYVGVETNFCAVSPASQLSHSHCMVFSLCFFCFYALQTTMWSAWKFSCPCKVGTRSRSLMGDTHNGCKKPRLSQSRPCKCGTTAPTPNPNDSLYIGTIPTPAPGGPGSATASGGVGASSAGGGAADASGGKVLGTVRIVGTLGVGFGTQQRKQLQKAMATVLGMKTSSVMIKAPHKQAEAVVHFEVS